MLIKFFKHGQGSGEPPVNYLIAEKVLAYDENRDLIRDENGQPTFKTRDPLPEVLKGNPDITTELINGNPHKWSYRAGVVAFADGDNPSEVQQREVMEEFERLAFAGLEGEQYDILWVRHQHEGNIELHFCTPRLELTTGKSLNIAPPGYQKTYDTLRDYLNKTHGWADPMGLERRQEVKAVIEPPERAESREALHEWVSAQIVTGKISDRQSMITAFEEIGFTINRQGKEYLSVKDPETDQKFRLKGEIYHEHWNVTEYDQRALATENPRADQRDPRLDQYDLDQLRRQLREHARERANYHGERYPNSLSRNARELSEAEVQRDEMEPAALADCLPYDGRNQPEHLGNVYDQPTSRDEPLRASGDLSEHIGRDADLGDRSKKVGHQKLQAFWEGLLLPEADGGMNVTHTYGEGTARICEGAERILRKFKRTLGLSNPLLDRIIGIARKLTERSGDGIERIRKRTDQLREANSELGKRYQATCDRAEETERVVKKIEEKQTYNLKKGLDYDLEL